jgi:hypothetical protein
MVMTTSIRIGCSVSATRTFLSCAGALGCRTRRFGCRGFIATIGSYTPIVNFAGATIRLASVALLAEQLNI